MDLSKLLEPPAGYIPHDVISLTEENDRLRRVLCATARAYNSAKSELETAKEILGYYRTPLLFLRFPREVRDQIYLYALQSHLNAKPEPPQSLLFTLESISWRPSTPGLCLVNKQIYQESVEILYSKNVFNFSLPGELLRFEEQIGSANRDLIRRIEISMAIPVGTAVVVDAQLIHPCDYLGVPAHWAMALSRSKLKNILELEITVIGDYLDNPEWRLIMLPIRFQQSIECIFRRNHREGTPQLTIRGIWWEQRNMFPAHWNIRTA